MRCIDRKSAGYALAGAVLVLACAGCGGTKTGFERYIPAKDTARRSLETALDVWVKDGRPGTVAGTSPTIEVVDSRWKAGQKLASYEILQQEPGDGPPRFSVRLKLKKSPGDEVVRYVVLGRDPLWVYREDDYNRLSGM
jgi:hypothetical protein